MRNQPTSHDPVFHERPYLLSSKGYRGFTIKGNEQYWEGVKITVSNRICKSLSASESTEHEALMKLIDQIDMILDG